MTQPDDLTARIFRRLYPGFDLVIIGSTYAVYPPAGHGGPLMLISDSLGAIARQIAELENPGVELADLISDADGPLPHRHPH